MFLNQNEIVSLELPELLTAAEKAIRAIPPAFPLEATVAVNPFLGQTNENLATTAARLGRVAGIPVTQTRATYAAAIHEKRITDEDLTNALAASGLAKKPANLALLKKLALTAQSEPKPKALPTVADIAAEATGIDWPSVIEKTFGLWAAGHFDRGQALWSPKPDSEAYASWRIWAMQDLTPEIAGLKGFCEHVTQAPDSSERAILRTAKSLGLEETSAETAFHRLLMELGGWSQHARWLLWQAELAEGTDRTLADLLAIRLIWEEALLLHVPGIKDEWMKTVAAHSLPVESNEEHTLMAILQDAADRAYQRKLTDALDGSADKYDQPFLQAAFCIDVRSEVFRRALESVSPRVETIGFAGFFGLPIAHKAHGSDVTEAHLPVLLSPAMETTSHTEEKAENNTRITARAARAWGRFRQAAVSSFAFVEAAGPIYAGKLLEDSLALGAKLPKQEPKPEMVGALSAEEKADTAATILKAMSLTENHGKIILLLGHGGHVTNNPHESAYHCGACGGHTGEVSARVLAALLNDPQTRDGLADRGIQLPKDTLFIAGMHNTTTDEIIIYEDNACDSKQDDIKRIRGWLKEAGEIARKERAITLHGCDSNTVASRAFNWAETRPEWGLAGCAAFIAAPRSATTGKDLGGRTFLHSYDWEADEGFNILELIITAPVVVASWISLQYYGSSVAPEVFGGGNKLIHNVVGGIGVIEGNNGRLRPGLPWQSVHDGEKLAHEPLRLSVMIEAPREAIINILEQHPEVLALFDNGWLHLFTLMDGKVDARYLPGMKWEDKQPMDLAA